MNKLHKGSVALDEHARIQGNSKRMAKFRYSCSLMFATSICKEDEGYAVFLKEREGFSSARERIGTPE